MTSDYSVAASMGYGWICSGQVMTWKGEDIWFGRFSNNSERSGPGLYIGNTKKGKRVILTEEQAKLVPGHQPPKET